MKESIVRIFLQGENAIIVEKAAIMLGIAQKKEEDLIQEEDTIVEEDIGVDQEVTIIGEDIQGQEVLDQGATEKEVIEDIEDIKVEVGAEEVEIVVIMIEAGIVKEAEIIEINLVEVITALIGVIQEVKEVIIVNSKILKIIKKMKKIIKMEMKI